MVTIERAKQILACYGGKPEQWPVDERLDLQQFLLSNTDLQLIQQQALELDEQLVKTFTAFKGTDTQYLQKNILANLPDRKKPENSQFSEFLTPINKSLANAINKLFSPAGIMATVTMLVLLTIGVFNFKYETPALISNGMDDELLLMAEALDGSDELELLAILEPELFEDTSDIM